MNILLLKQTAVLSAIAGVGLALLTIFPYLNIFTLMILFVCLSGIVLIYMKKKNLIGIFDIREGSILGAISGFSSFIAFSIVYVPLDIILGLIFKHYYLKYFLNSFGSFVVLVMLTIFIAMLSALTNGFGGLVTAYVYEILTGFKKEENENYNFEIK